MSFTGKHLSKLNMDHRYSDSCQWYWKHKLREIALLGQVQGWSVLILTQAYINTTSFFFLFFLLKFVPPYKCGQLVWCKAFNAVVTSFFPDISSFIVGLSLLLSLMLILKRVISFRKAFPRWLGSNLPQCFPNEAQLLGNYCQSIIIFSSPQPIVPKT